MTLSFYFDQHMPGPITRGLRRRDIDVLTTEEDGSRRWKDERLLERSTELGRVFVTEDDDLLGIAHRWLQDGRAFAGLVKATDPMSAIGRVIEDLEIIARCYEPHEAANQILYVPF